MHVSHRQWLWTLFTAVIGLSLIQTDAKNSSPNDDLIFDEMFITKAIAAAELSILAKDDDPKDLAGEYDFFEALQGIGNQAIVAKREGICYVAYGSEEPGRFQQLMQRLIASFSLDFDNISKLCFDDCCKIRTPVKQQFETLHVEVEPAVEKCRETCGETTPCQLILTGHHQGGARVQFAYANPTGYTFGAPQVFSGGCKALDSTRWYRFVNTRESQHRREYGIPPGGVVYDFVPLSYDAVPAKDYRFSKHVGYQLTMALDLTIANLGLDANRNFRVTSGVAGSMMVDSPDRYKAGYLDRLRFIQDYFTFDGEYPVPHGYYQRDICTLDEECQEGLVCQKLCPLCPPRCDPPEERKEGKNSPAQ